MKKVQRAITYRNSVWEENVEIPKWVQIDSVGLDQFFTKKEIAESCYKKLLLFLSKEGVQREDCLFVEPSAGCGSFFDLLPQNQRIGLDILPMKQGILEQEFLSWTPPKTDKKIVVIGNPPFGYRAWLALLFMQKAATFADYVAFILPMSFQSEGKGSPKNRIKNLKIISSEILPKNSFVTPDGKEYQINSLFQIWTKGREKLLNITAYKDYCDIFTVDNRKERLCGQEKMKQADFFLQRTFFNNPPKLVHNFRDVKYVCGYGFILKKEEKEIYDILAHVDWFKYSNLAAHGCRHISMYHIWKALSDYGFTTTY